MSEFAETRGTPGADEAAGKLRNAALEHYEKLKQAVAEASRAVIALRAAIELDPVMSAATDLTAACDELTKTADLMHKSCDAALLACLDETRGGDNFSNERWTIFPRNSSGWVDIPDIQAVPPHYFAPAQPDTRKIKDLLKHTSVNWARLAPGKRSLSRRPKL